MRALRMHKSETARAKRKQKKNIMFYRTVAMFAKLRRKRKNK